MKLSGAEMIEIIRSRRFAAHQLIFEGSHDDAPSPAHRELVECFWSDEQHLVIEGFRGFAKSTVAEEAIAIAACDHGFHHCLFVGPSWDRAVERLEAVKNEIENNDYLVELCQELYGFELPGHPWLQDKAALKTGIVMTALGVGQKIRGIKFFSHRPDLIIVDDFEDEKNVLTPAARDKMLRWFLRTLALACHPRARWRVLSTLMDADCVPERLVKEAGWPVRRFPVSYLDSEGEERATWPARFPMSWVERERAKYARLGAAGLWDLEMMCDASVEAGEKDFKPEYFPIEPRVRTWESVYAVFDPARTHSATSASTGIPVFSWVGHQLVVWEDRTGFYKPSEMIQIMFEIEEKYHPLVIGFEENGLEEWARELIRGECHKRGVFLPVERLRAPRDKFAFIRALEPLGRAGEIVFARECPLLREQFLTFPRGRIDGPNALAYALQLRPGRLIYDGWNPLVHIAPITLGREPCYVAANATKTLVTGVVVQLVDGRVRILADFVADGDPGEAVEGVLRSAALAAGRNLTVIAGPQHFDQWTNVGLVQAARRSGVECRPGGSAETGRAFIRGELEKVRGVEGANIAVSIEARWTLRAFAGGYARPVQNGLTADEAAPGRYRVLMEGLEQLCGVFAWGQETAEQNVAYDHAGKPYLSIIPPRERVNA